MHFSSVKPINLSGTNDWRGLELYFERSANPPPADEKVESLRRGFEQAVQKTRMAARNEGEFLPIFNKILDAAKSSLVVAGGTVKDGEERLAEIQTDILNLARKRRRGYFVNILAVGLVVSVVGLVLWGLLELIPLLLPSTEGGYLESYRAALAWIVPACLILPGASLGIVFVGFATNTLLTFDKVGRLDQYDFFPWERFVWVSLIAFVLLAALWFDLFVIGIGNVALNKVREEPSFGFLIGLVCGISEALIADLLIKRFQPVIRE